MSPKDYAAEGLPIKAYKDADFINSPAARPMRILAEYLGPRDRFDRHKIRDTIVFFGSARLIPRELALDLLEKTKASGGDTGLAERALMMSEYYEATRELAKRLTQWSKELENKSRRFVICSGGGPGIMEAANRGASEAAGENIGLGISLPFEQAGNPYITRELNFEFHYFFTRKFWFSYLAKAFIVMPGGFGTLDELMEILTLIQTRKMTKTVPIVLFGKTFWERIINFQALVDYGTISPADLELFVMTDSLDEAFSYVTETLLKVALDKPGGSM